MPSAREKRSGKRHVTATACHAPIDAPVVHSLSDSSWQSLRMAGTTSCFTYWWNWCCIHMRYWGVPSLPNQTCPPTESHE
jgi:hypothetical protein